MDANTTGLVGLIVIVGTLFLGLVLRRFFIWKEKQLEANTALAAEKAAQYAASNAQLEQRVRVLEQIVTDAGAETAAQIEALRDRPAAVGKNSQELKVTASSKRSRED
jgi:hypothetical protein